MSICARHLAVALTLAASLTCSVARGEQPPEYLINAMEVDSADLVSGSVDTDGSSATMFDVRSALGVISPYNAPTFAVMSTGNVNNIEALEDYDYPGSGADTSAGDHATLEFQLVVPAGANSFSFRFYFLSREYPEWVGSEYNDTFEVQLQGSIWSGQMVFDAFGNEMTVNNALFTVVNAADLVGTGFDYDGGTGWVQSIGPCAPGETITLTFEIYDVADGVWDSAVLLDNFAFSSDLPPEDGPWTGIGPGDDDDSASDDDDATDDDDFADDDDTVDDDDFGDDDDFVDDDDAVVDDDDAAAPCTVRPLAHGSLETPGGSSFALDGLEVAYDVQHNQDVDADDGGCIVRAALQLLEAGDGCGLALDFILEEDRLLLQNLSLEAGSFCPGWTDEDEGSYVLSGGEVVLGGTRSTPEHAAASSCIEDAIFEPAGTATLTRAGDGELLELALDGISFTGDFLSLGVDGYACPDAAEELPPGGGGGGSRGACACSSTSGPGASWLSLLVLAAWGRRRLR